MQQTPAEIRPGDVFVKKTSEQETPTNVYVAKIVTETEIHFYYTASDIEPPLSSRLRGVETDNLMTANREEFARNFQKATHEQAYDVLDRLYRESKGINTKMRDLTLYLYPCPKKRPGIFKRAMSALVDLLEEKPDSHGCYHP